MRKPRSDSSSTQVTPNPELEKRTRRRFPAEYKLLIIAEADACKHGELGGIPRHEKLIVTNWLIGVESTAFLKEHGLEGSMSRRGHCHDNAVAESFFQLLKRERAKKQTYSTKEVAKRDIFNYIEMFYNPVRRHTANNLLSPVEFERQLVSET